MAGDTRSMARSLAAKLLLGAALIGIAVQVTGLPTRTAAAPPPARPAIAAAAAAKPAAPAAPAVIPAAAAEQPFVVKRILTIDGPFKHGDYYWDESGAPAVGPLVITVDLAAQVLSVFRDGYEIGTAVIVYGADEKPTPLGVFPITQKDADHVSNLYDAPMPYMLRLTDDGVSIHGSEVDWQAASHGCIGVPVKFARLLFGRARLGDKVIITNGERLELGAPIPAA